MERKTGKTFRKGTRRAGPKASEELHSVWALVSCCRVNASHLPTLLRAFQSHTCVSGCSSFLSPRTSALTMLGVMPRVTDEVCPHLLSALDISYHSCGRRSGKKRLGEEGFPLHHALRVWSTVAVARMALSWGCCSLTVSQSGCADREHLAFSLFIPPGIPSPCDGVLTFDSSLPS